MSLSRLSDKQIAFLLASMAAVMPFSIDAYLPAVPDMALALGASEASIQSSLTLFLLGQACGVLLGGTWSDWKGRRTVVLAGLAVYCLASLGLVMMQSLEHLWLLRLLQAVGAGMVAVNGGAIVRDYYEGQKAAQMFALIGVIMMAAPLLAPMIGWLMIQIGGWRAIFVFLMLYALAVLLLQWRFLPVHRPEPPQEALWRVIIGRYRRVFTTREALGFLFFQAFSFSSMFSFLHESPSVYMGVFALDKGGYTLVFAANILTMTAFNRITAWRLKRGNRPHYILLGGIAVQLLANSLLLMTAWGTMTSPWLYMGLVTLSVGTQGLITANTQASFMSYFRSEGGSASGVLMSSQTLIAAGVGFLLATYGDGTVRTMPVVMLSCTLLGMGLLFACSYKVWTGKKPLSH